VHAMLWQCMQCFGSACNALAVHICSLHVCILISMMQTHSGHPSTAFNFLPYYTNLFFTILITMTTLFMLVTLFD